MALSKIDSGAFENNTPAIGGVFFLSSQTVDADYTIPANYNAMSAGPIEITTGVTVTITTGSEWAIV